MNMQSITIQYFKCSYLKCMFVYFMGPPFVYDAFFRGIDYFCTNNLQC